MKTESKIEPSSSSASRTNLTNQTRGGEKQKKEERQKTSAVSIREGNGNKGLARQGEKEGEMTTHRHSPFSLMHQLTDEMDRLWQNFGFGTSLFRPRHSTWESLVPSRSEMWTPEIDVFQRGDQFVVRVDVPGVNKDDLTVELSDGTLTIQGERREQHEENEENYYRSERSCGSFFRAIPLPEGADTENISATFKDGVLEVQTKCPESAKSRQRIEIQLK